MKRIVVMAVLALAMPLGAFAGTIDFTNRGGTLKSIDDNTELSLASSELVQIGGLQGDLGKVSFTTGALTSGTLAGGAVFAAGGSFDIRTNGQGGFPDGLLFKGSFSSTVKWEVIGGTQCTSTGSVCYELSGQISGTWYGRSQPIQVSGATIQLVFNAGKNGFMGSAPLQSGDTVIMTPVPEPGTLGLLGTGLVGLGGVLRRKFKV